MRPPMTAGEADAFERGRTGAAMPTHAPGAIQDAYNLGDSQRRRQRASSASTHGGGGGAGIAALFLLWLALLIAGPAALSSVVSGLVLLLLLALLRQGGDLTYWDAYKACFFATAAFIALALGVRFGAEALVRDYGTQTYFTHLVRTVIRLADGSFQMMSSPEGGWQSLVRYHVALAQARPDATSITAIAAAVLLVPSLLAAVVTLIVRDDLPFSGWPELVMAIVVTATVLIPGLAITGWGMIRLTERVQLVNLGRNAPLDKLAIAAGVLALLYLVIGAVVASLLVRLLVLGRTDADARFLRYRAKGTSFLVLTTYCVGIALALLLFRHGDPLVQWIGQWLPHGGSTSHASVQFWSGFVAFLPLQLPGVLAAGAIITARHDRHFKGVLGYAAACIAAGTASWLLWLPVMAVGIVAYRAGLLA
jgi:hypothetical protein